jgi:hypothetical protein
MSLTVVSNLLFVCHICPWTYSTYGDMGSAYNILAGNPDKTTQKMYEQMGG